MVSPYHMARFAAVEVPRLVSILSRIRSSVSSRSASPGGLVPADAADAGKPHRHAGFVPGRPLQALEGDLEHQPLAAPCSPRAPGRSARRCCCARSGRAAQFLIRETEIRLADRHEFVAVCALASRPRRCSRNRTTSACRGRAGRTSVRRRREGIALPFPPWPFRPARHIGRVAPLQHDAFDRLGIGARAGGAGSARAAASSSQLANGTSGERSTRGSPSLRDAALPARARRSIERQRAHILAAFDQQIVGAQMQREIPRAAWRHGLAVEPLLQHVEASARGPSRTTSNSPSIAHRSRSARPDRESCRRCPRRCGSRAAHRAAVGHRPQPPARGCRPISIRRRNPPGRARRDRSRRSRARASAGETARDRAFAACRRGLRARRTVEIGRRKPVPDLSISCRPCRRSAASAVLASRAETPMRSAAGHQLQQRPASGLVERVEPARELRGQLGFAERGAAWSTTSTTSAGRGVMPCCLGSPATSAPRSRTRSPT